MSEQANWQKYEEIRKKDLKSEAWPYERILSAQSMYFIWAAYLSNRLSIQSRKWGKLMILYIYDNMIWYRWFFCFFFFWKCRVNHIGLWTALYKILKLVEIYWDLLKFIEINWNLLKCIEIYRNLLQFISITISSISISQLPIYWDCN